MARPIITLLSDFGQRDTFVGQMKGILLTYCRDAELVDLTHQVSPQSIIEGALHLAASWRAFPPGTIHLVVVDPGVGTERRAIALRHRGQFFVLPDNGLISAVLRDALPEVAVQISTSGAAGSHVSSTFHGRDVFAPAAGRLACGMTLDEIGSPLDPAEIVRLGLPTVVREGPAIEGEIILVDHFGNAITNIEQSGLTGEPRRTRVSCGNFSACVSQTYQDVEPGEPVALVSSMGTLELAVREGSAAETFGLDPGMAVKVTW